jgi:hypothetical protein
MDSIDARLARAEGETQIRQLPSRYAAAVDARDMDALVNLFVDDVDCGRRGRGRAILKGFFEAAGANFYRSVHQITGHTFDIIEKDHAEGRVYCRAEHEFGDQWIVSAICYFDRYAPRGDEWFFVSRTVDFFYSSDLLEHPQDVGFQRWATDDMRFVPPMMAHHFPQWNPFWAAHGDDAVAAVTRQP